MGYFLRVYLLKESGKAKFIWKNFMNSAFNKKVKVEAVWKILML